MDGVFEVMKQECVFRIRNIPEGSFYVVAQTLETNEAYIVERNEYETWTQGGTPLYWVFKLDMTKAVESDGQPLYMLQDLLNEPLPNEKKVTLEELRESRCPMTVRKRREFHTLPDDEVEERYVEAEKNAHAEVIARGESGDFYRFLLPFDPFWTDDEVRKEYTYDFLGERFFYKTMTIRPVGIYHAPYDE